MLAIFFCLSLISFKLTPFTLKHSFVQTLIWSSFILCFQRKSFPVVIVHAVTMLPVLMIPMIQQIFSASVRGG